MTISDSAYVRRFFSLYSQEEKDKIRGHAFYPTDYLSALLPEGVAHLRVVRSPHPGATFTKIKSDKAMKVSGMLRVITAHDIPKNAPFASRSAKAQLILAEKEVRYEGEPVALLVGQTEEATAKALELLEIDWKPTSLPAEEEVKKIKHATGKAKAGEFKEIRAKFEFPSLQTRYLEAESGWVEFKPKDESFTFHVGALLSESQRTWLAQVIEVPIEKLTAKETPLGGQFGGRQQRELLVFLAVAARLCQKSVCLHLTQENQDTGSYGFKGEMRLRYDPAESKFVDLKGEVLLDAGSYEGNAELALMKALEHGAGIYDFDHVEIEGRVLLTPTHPRRALKGEGLTAITWVVEQLVEQAAKDLGVAPLELRLTNIRKNSERVDSVLREVEKWERPFRLLEIDRNRPIWDEKAISGRGFGFQVFEPMSSKEFDYSEVSVEMQAAGTFIIRTSNLTIDLHVKSALQEVAAQVLKTHPKALTVEGMMRAEFTKAARRETYPEFYHLAQATWHAAAELKKRLIQAGQKIFSSKDVELKDGAVVDQAANKKMGYRELAFTHPITELKASYQLKNIERPHGCSAGAVARVSFHPLTGEVSVNSVKVVIDAGPVLYRKGLETEVESAVAWAMATLFSSGLKSDQPIPTPLDGPEEVTVMTIDYPLDDISEKAPEYFGARGINDAVMSVVLASLVNAIRDAKGVSLESIPLPLEFIYPNRRKSHVTTINFKRT